MTSVHADEQSLELTVRRKLMIGASVLALGLAAPAFAQSGDGQPAPPEDPSAQAGETNPATRGAVPAQKAESDDEDIVVTGLRASIASAQAIKMNSGQFVDSVTSVDIGKLPDLNVAEALQRISGIQITRNRGEGSGIAIRGLTQVRTEVNGRDSFGAWPNRKPPAR